MKPIPRPRDTAARFLGRLLSVSLCVWAFGALNAPAVAFAAEAPILSATPESVTLPPVLALASTVAVPVDQAPLIVQKPLPPNIVLMLDDSGSMRWDMMPDYGSISDKSTEGLINSGVNGVYYNPDVTYTPPPKADGSLYATPDFGDAPVNGFDTDSTKVNVGEYRGAYDSYSTAYLGTLVQYSVSVADVSGTNYSPSTSCPTGTTASGTYSGYCYYTGTFNKDTGPPTTRFDFFTNNYFYVSRCTSIDDVYTDARKAADQTCTPGHSFFTYTTGDKSGGYTRHYVAKETGDCALAGLDSAVCDDSDTARQNVANWFSYYHTRILMAKSGLMSAFSDVDATYRVGFGSINNGNTDDINVTGNAYYNGASHPKCAGSSNCIAEVAAFGDGSTGTQKAYFWNWVNNIIPPQKSTPLRNSLQAVGKYYSTKQPWQTSNSDATCYACRQSYTILTTDGFWNGGSPGVGDADSTLGTKVTGPNGQSYTYTPALPYADAAVVTETKVFETCAKGYDLVATGPGAPTCLKVTKKGRKKYQDACPSGGTYDADSQKCTETKVTGTTYSDTLADVAMKYWLTDLRSDISNEVPPSKADPAFWQHMVTFTLGLGFTPIYTSSGDELPVDQVFAWANGDASKAIDGFSWPQPKADSIYNIADLAHAAVDGHGGFYSAKTPEAFTSGLKKALARAAERVGTGASLAANSTQLQTGTVAYQANYYTGTWKGDLKALTVDSSSGQISPTPTWAAADKMPAAADRDIHTYNPDTKTYVAFSNATTTSGGVTTVTGPPSLSATQLTALGSDDSAQESLVDYLRGDQAKEQSEVGGLFRNRTSVLGDIVDSQPIFLGTPDPNEFNNEAFTGSGKYAAFAADNVARTPQLYAAANDGMLHAFDASTGVEQYAYLPGAVITSGLASLSDPNYGTATAPHQYFNDGELTIAAVYFTSDDAWHSVLVGTTGRGVAKSVYALDVTDPADIKFLWERSAADGKTGSTYIGQMVGKPVIAQIADGSWAVLMGNGYDSAAGKAALLQFDLGTGDLSVHPTTDGTGLAAPVTWIENLGNGVSTMAYAGDLSGHVWSFSLNTGSTTATSTPDSDGTLLYTAKDALGNAQPITGGMLVGRDPLTSNLWVFFGTGKYLTAADLTDTSTQSWYGLIVRTTDAVNHPAVTSTSTRSDLVKRQIIAQTAGDPGTPEDDSTDPPTPAVPPTLPARVITKNTAGDLDKKSGWYMDLLAPKVTVDGDGKVTYDPSSPVAAGERMVAGNQFQGSLLVGTTRIPQANDVCNPSGKGWIMAIDPFTGGNPDPEFFDVNGDGLVNGGDAVLVGGTYYPVAGVGFNSLPNTPIFVGGHMLTSFDNGTNASIQTAGTGGVFKRVSWRELVNP